MTRPLTETELELMNVLWQTDEATVRDVHESLPPGRAYTTIATELQILAEKGYLTAEKRGRALVYRPAVARPAYARSGLKAILHRLFGGDPASLVRTLVADDELTPDQIAAIRDEIARLEGP